MTIPTIIIPIRVSEPAFEVYLGNLVLSAESVSKQNIHCKNVLVDYGSESAYVKSIKDVAQNNGLTYLRGEGPIWSRSCALNVGIKNAPGDVILFVDADCVIPPNYVQENIKFINSRAFTFNLVYDSLEGVRQTGNYNDVLASINGQGIHDTRPDGFSHMGVMKQWFSAHGGYNEAYKGWGGEDNDLFVRLTRSGVGARNTNIHPIHIWHPPYSALMEKIGKKDVYERLLVENRTRFFNFRDGK